MPKHLEMQLRAWVAALLSGTGVAYYDSTYHDRFVSLFCGSTFLFYLAYMCIIGFNHDLGIMAKAVDVLAGIRQAIDRIANGRNSECREHHAAKR